MAKGYWTGIAAAAVLALVSAPVHGQLFSDSFEFLKAVRDRDGQKAMNLIASPGSVVINSKERGTGNSALHILARERDMTWLTFLLAKGAKPNIQNSEGNTPLAVAAQIGWPDGAEQLLKEGASVDLANNRGETPLILAVHRRDIAMVRLLLARGANPKRTDSVAGYSALDYAKQDRRSEAILRVLEAGAAKKPGLTGPVL